MRATTNAALANFVNMLISIVTVVAVVAAVIVELAPVVVLCWGEGEGGNQPGRGCTCD